MDAIASDCITKKHAVVKEPHIPTALGTHKPDLLICDLENKKAYVLDVKIASDSSISTMADQYQRKVEYYDTGQIRCWAALWATQQLHLYNESQDNAVSPSTTINIQPIDPQEVVLGAVIITWRGVMSPKTYKILNKELRKLSCM
ncbi:hypothetical protein OTU49_006130 [Cherax quadricarinatus]|uniref:PD-(D/E)XK endonuclease-like domain-containing protein n=1 Tax=Cherax quadricarinatus TaxID=27406 RepID=A0AAW0X4I6_CHEQU